MSATKKRVLWLTRHTLTKLFTSESSHASHLLAAVATLATHTHLVVTALTLHLLITEPALSLSVLRPVVVPVRVLVGLESLFCEIYKVVHVCVFVLGRM